jgi:ribosome-binding protein aMBF1 (putative translation factor)
MIQPRRAKRVMKRLSDAEKAKYAQMRTAVERELPPGKARRPPRDPNQPADLGEYFDLRAVVGELRKAREAHGLSLADVQERTGIDRSALCRIESGENGNPTVNTLIRYARAVGRTINVVLVETVPAKAR